MVTRAVSEGDLGAWLIKCDPETKFDLPGAMADGMTVIRSWSVVPGYRADMMSPGDKIVLWVSGNGERMQRGIWGLGEVTGEVEPDDHDGYFSDVDYWLDQDARRAVELFAPVEIQLLESAVSAADLVNAGITDLEVQRVAQGSNPSWVSVDQLERLEPLLPEWPTAGSDNRTIAVSRDGAGFGSPEKNAVVEAIAMAQVIDFYGSAWHYEDVSQEKVGWDITFTHGATGEIARVEVKGVSGSTPVVLLTANEIRAAENQPGWHLAVVTSALNAPAVVEYTADQALKAAEPYVYKAKLDT